MKLRYQVSRAASRDLREIACYTRDTWGDNQQHTYLAKLERVFDMLAEQPSLGIARTEFSGVRSIHVGHHVIFYAAKAAGILIVRILHERQDPMRHMQS